MWDAQAVWVYVNIIMRDSMDEVWQSSISYNIIYLGTLEVAQGDSVSTVTPSFLLTI